MIQFFLKKSVVTISLNLAILLIGYFSFDNLANEYIPAIEIPAVAIIFPTTIVQQEKVIKNLVAPSERSLLNTGKVNKIETTIEGDRTILLAHFDWSLKPEKCLQFARQAVTSVSRPPGVLEPIFVLHRPTLSPIFRSVIYGKKIEELSRVGEELQQKLQRAPGVADVRIAGSSPKTGLIVLDSAKAAAKSVTPLNVYNSARNIWGFRTYYSNDNKRAQYLRLPMVSSQSVSELPVLNGQGESSILSWVSTYVEKTKPAEVLFGTQNDAVIIEVLKTPGADALSIGDEVLKALGNVQSRGFQTQILYNEAEKIKESQQGVLQNFAIGVGLNCIILMVFLGSIVGVVVASCVFPTSILGTLFIMENYGVSLNIFALNGFSLAAGMITDASTVVLEAIMARFEKETNLFTACWKGANDVIGGVFASTMTTAAVIIPICMQTGITAKLFSDLGVSLISTQFVCLIAVFSMVPWLCLKLLKRNEAKPVVVDFCYRGSTKLVNMFVGMASSIYEWSMPKPKKWLLPGLVGLTCAVAIYFIPNSEFLPQVGSSVYTMSIPIKRSELSYQRQKYIHSLAQVLGKNEFVEWVTTDSNADSLKAIFKVKPNADIEAINRLVAKELQQNFFSILTLPVGPTPGGEPLGYDAYHYIAKDIGKEKYEKIFLEFCDGKYILDCKGRNHYSETKAILKAKGLEMFRMNTSSLQTILDFKLSMEANSLSALGNLNLSTPILLKIKEGIHSLESPIVIGDSYQKVTSLGAVYDKKISTGENVAFRRNFNDYYPIYYRLGDISMVGASERLYSIMNKYDIPTPKAIPMGTLETMNDTFDKMIKALLLSAFLVYVVLVLQFKSFLQSFVIMLSIPLSLGGAILGLLLFKETLNVGVMVGFILLVGIIVNNSILLVEALNQRLLNGYDLVLAISEAVKARTRPILMTSCSTIFGMLPTILIDTEGAELYRGMAVVNVFGMFFGTFLTLVVMPIIIRNVLGFSKQYPAKVMEV